jgi:hypothetical protein
MRAIIDLGGFSMKKSKFLILGIIALLLAGGLVLASCGDPDCDYGCGKKPSKCVSLCKGKGGLLDLLDCEFQCGVKK